MLAILVFIGTLSEPWTSGKILMALRIFDEEFWGQEHRGRSTCKEMSMLKSVKEFGSLE